MSCEALTLAASVPAVRSSSSSLKTSVTAASVSPVQSYSSILSKTFEFYKAADAGKNKRKRSSSPVSTSSSSSSSSSTNMSEMIDRIVCDGCDGEYDIEELNMTLEQANAIRCMPCVYSMIVGPCSFCIWPSISGASTPTNGGNGPLAASFIPLRSLSK